MTVVHLIRLDESGDTSLLYNYECFCRHCGRSMGRFTADEVAAISRDLSLYAGLCFDCTTVAADFTDDGPPDYQKRSPFPAINIPVRLLRNAA